MSTNAELITRLRGMVHEPDDTHGYTDDVLTAFMQRHPLTDPSGEPPFIGTTVNPRWTLTYDMHRAAADVWEEKAVAKAHLYQFSDGKGSFSRQQIYKQFMQNVNYHLARRVAGTGRAKRGAGGITGYRLPNGRVLTVLDVATLDAINALIGDATLVNGDDLAEIATSGSYTDLTDVPTEFPPSSHSHAGYASSTHSHEIGAIDATGVADDSLFKASGEAIVPITVVALRTLLGLATVATSGRYPDLSEIPSEFTPSAHTHNYEAAGAVSGHESNHAPADATATNAANVKSAGAIMADGSVAEERSTTTQSLAYAIDLSSKNVQVINLTGNVAITFSNIPASGAANALVKFVQDGIGGRVPTFPAATEWIEKVAPTLTTDANAKDWLTFWSEGGVVTGAVVGLNAGTV